MKVEKRWMSKITGKLWDTPGAKNEIPVAVIPWDEWEAEIKAAREEVLEWLLDKLCDFDVSIEEASIYQAYNDKWGDDERKN